MSEAQENHSIFFEQIAYVVCNKSAIVGIEECMAGKNSILCREYGKCRIHEKTQDQFSYVIHPLEQSIFLSACPGSGKTEVVGLKAAYEIKQWNQRFSGIAVLTFTNNATAVIRDRVVQFIGTSAIGFPHYIGTIDSWLHRHIAHPFAHRITGFEGVDGDHSIRIVENSSNAAFLNNYQTPYSLNKTGNVKGNQFYYDLWEDKFVFWSGKITVDSIRNKMDITERLRRDLGNLKNRFFRAGFATYQDIEFLCYRLLSNQDISQLVSARFPFIIIDECQDLSGNQLTIFEPLLKAGISVHFVGDLDQSIYSFKGVYPENIQAFIEQNNFSTLELTDNFRSIQEIVDICSNIVDQEGITGHQIIKGDFPTCVYFTYDNEGEMASLPERFAAYLSTNNINTEKSAVLARNYNIIGRLRSHGNPRDKSISYYPAIAISSWINESRSIEQTEEAILTMGKILAEKLFSSSSSNSQKYYCPENVSSIEWRIFIARILEECCRIEELVNFQQTWSNWSKSFRQNIEEILHKAKSNLYTITLPENIRATLRYQAPKGEANKAVIGSIHIPSQDVEGGMRITTFHKIKGETLDSALVVSSRTAQGGGGGYWQKWLEDGNSEEARFAYVASSRPRYLLAWGIPLQDLNDEKRSMLEQLGFTEVE